MSEQTTNIFEVATREAYRYKSQRGEITTEDLWNLPLESKSGFDLDSVAKEISRELKSSEEESFVKKSSSTNTILKTKLEIVKYIIGIKLAEAEERRNAEEKKAKKQKLLEILSKKQDEKIGNMSEEEILKELESL